MSSLTSILPPPSSRRSSTLLTPSTQPVPLLSTPLAKGYSYASIAGTLLLYYLRADALVSDPLATLVQDAVPLALFQSLFCAVCLPAAGNWYSGTGDLGRGERLIEGSSTPSKKAANTSVPGSLRKKAGTPGTPAKGAGAAKLAPNNITVAGGSWQGRVMPTIFSLVLAVAVPPVPLAVLALVLGAPLYPTMLIPHTFALAVHVSILGFLPIFYTHGVSSAAWLDVVAAWLPFDEAGVWSGLVGTMVGGWIGAIPIALDWDREWQKWPCTVVWGGVLGWAIGKLLTSVLKLGVGSRINLSATSSNATAPPRIVVDEDSKRR